MFFHCVNEDIKQAHQICGTGHVFRVELHTGDLITLIYIWPTELNHFWTALSHPPLPEQRLCVVYDAFTGVIVGVGKEDVPVFGQGVGVDGEPVVLTGDEAAVCSLMDARLVVTTVTVPEIKDQITKFIHCSLF